MDMGPDRRALKMALLYKSAFGKISGDFHMACPHFRRTLSSEFIKRLFPWCWTSWVFASSQNTFKVVLADPRWSLDAHWVLQQAFEMKRSIALYTGSIGALEGLYRKSGKKYGFWVWGCLEGHSSFQL